MTKKRALIVDDEADIRELLAMTLAQMDLEVDEAETLSEAIEALNNTAYAFCLTDMKLPDGSGMDLISVIQNKFADMPVAMITAYGNTEIAVEALKLGAFDFVTKPIELPRLRSMVEAALALATQTPVNLSKSAGKLTGDSAVMDKLRQQILRVARSQAPIFIHGESGSGKEIVARNIHYSGPKAEGPFIPVNCGAIPSELMESEFFGHTKGSFTGAHQDKKGLFQSADGGTLFLDEVADLPLSMQVKLLRGIQEKAVRPLGAEREIPVDIRILSASHKDLDAEIAAGNFREDLYYRINVIELQVPSLRDRRDDIEQLTELFLAKFAADFCSEPVALSAEALDTLLHYPFPGNVRELENTLERAFTLCDGELISSDDLQLKARKSSIKAATEVDSSHQQTAPASANSSLYNSLHNSEQNPHQLDGQSIDDYLAAIEKDLLEKALEQCRWNKTAAAEKLGITFRQLRYKLKKLNID
ncbi:MAG: sigma-54-dependent Fis family transcriptional regulator [Gammaproteobacteria bacterium]|nr:sigma-54-dependent Fis family transcriptional regulator [Gammaproteobacteria bacterium]MBQ0838316.1 sigma-54-dependent Fis family transcriptional regulator [Gammaproteobacteria bacterium]